MNLFSEQNSWIPALAALVVLATLILSSPRWLGWFLAKGRALRERFTPRATVARVNDVSHEIRKARNLALGLLVITGLIGLRHLNTVPYRLKVYDDNNRLETASDLFGSYYRPIREGEDAGGGVRFHSLKDAEEAWDRYDSPRLAALRAAEARTWLAAQAEQQAAEEQRGRQEQEQQREQWQGLVKMNDERAEADNRWWQRESQRIAELNRQERIRRVAEEQAQAFARDVTVRRAFSPNGRTPRARLVKWAAY
jgi:hypothetical protein